MFENGIFSYEISREGTNVYLFDLSGAKIIPIENLGLKPPLMFDFNKKYSINGQVVFIDSIICSQGYGAKVIYHTYKSPSLKEVSLKKCIQVLN